MEVSGPSGPRHVGGRNLTDMNELFREGKNLVQIKSNQVKLQQAGETLLSRLLTVKTEEKVRDKKASRMTLTKKENTVTHLVPLNASVHAAVEAHLAEHASTVVLREGPVDVLSATHKKNARRWMVLTETHLELRESQDKDKSIRKTSVISTTLERLPSLSLDMVTLKKSYQLTLSTSEETDLWLLDFLRARVRCASLVLDLVPPFRGLILSRTLGDHQQQQQQLLQAQGSSQAHGGSNSGANVFSGQSGHARNPSRGSTAPLSATNISQFAAGIRFAHLAYERVNVSYQIALQLHDTYVADVEKRLGHLDALSMERLASRKRIAEMESEIVAEERMSQRTGRDLSDTFGQVLESVGILHEALSETHKDLALVSPQIMTEDQVANVANFREVLDIVDVGLMMDKPLKQQIHELELREAEAIREVAELEQKHRELEQVLGKVKEKRALLESVTNMSGKLSSAVESAAKTVTSKTDADLSRIVAFAPLVRQVASRLPGVMDASESSGGKQGSVMDKTMNVEEYMDAIGGGGMGAAATLVSVTDSPRSDSSSSSSSSSEGVDFSISGILKSLFTAPKPDVELAVLRCFDYIIKPILLLEHVTLSFCEAPKVSHSQEEVASIEKRMATVRLRCLNFLRKWVKTHPYNFAEPQMRDLLKNFLACARLTGHEKLATLIESDMEVASGESMRNIFDAAPAVVACSLDVGGGRPASLHEVNALELARQLTLMDHDLYRKIEYRELIRNRFMKKQSPHVAEFSSHFNHVANVVAASVLLAPNGHAQLIQFWIDVMCHLRALRNYQGFFAVFGGLSGSAMNRMKRVWADVKNAAYFEQCKGMMDKNFAQLRHELEGAVRPVIPYLGFFQRDLVYLEESPTFKGSDVNLSKLISISNAIGNCLQYQNSFYNWFALDDTICGLIQQHQTLDEATAHELSLRIEPRGGGGAGVSVVVAPEITAPDESPSRFSKTIKRRGSQATKLAVSSGDGAMSPAVISTTGFRGSFDSAATTKQPSPRVISPKAAKMLGDPNAMPPPPSSSEKSPSSSRRRSGAQSSVSPTISRKEP